MRNLVREMSGELEKLVDAVHRDEVLRAEQRLRIEQLETKISDDFGMGLDDLINEYGPDVRCRRPPVEIAEYEAAKERGEQVTAPQPMPYDRATQQRRAKRAERDLTCWARSTRWRWRSSPRWRSATSSCPRSWRTSRPPAATC